jgi:hypothetical protein
MTVVLGTLMIVAVAAVIAYPLWRHTGIAAGAEIHDTRELLRREKSVALLAIREAELDRAMGKLSDEDYGTLRGQYERRAVDAIAELDKLEASPAAPQLSSAPRADVATARFCSSCGRRFQGDERFCPACGHARSVR